MLIASNKKKTCQLEFERKKYAQHLNRLAELRDGVSTEQLKRVQQEKRLAETINRVRKIHECNREYRWKCMKEIEANSKELDFSKVKSVLKQEIQKPFLQIAPRQKKDNTPIYQENVKIFERLCAVKPCLNLSPPEAPAKQKEEAPIQNDFTQLYKNSRLSQKIKRIVKIQLGSSKTNIKGVIELDFNFLQNLIKDDQSLYLLEFSCGKLKQRTEFFQFGRIETTQIHIKVPLKAYTLNKLSGKLIKMLSGINEKQILKSSFSVEEVPQDPSITTSRKKLKFQMNFKDLKMPRFKQMSQVQYKKAHQSSTSMISSPRTIMIR